MTRTRVGILCAVFAGTAAIGRAQAPKRAEVGNGPNFGTTTQVWQEIPASDFDPFKGLGGDPGSNAFYTSSWNPATSTFDYRRYVIGGDPRLAASPHLPGGAAITAIEYDYCDNGGAGRLNVEVYDCNAIGDCSGPKIDTARSVAGEGCVGVQHTAFPAYTVDNVDHKIMVLASWENYGDSLQLAGVSFGYTLQVFPAPASPTFGDVPVSDIGFQYIEALVASGITAGCGGGNYCPEASLTRRQMAVFLAKALGLNWSQ